MKKMSLVLFTGIMAISTNVFSLGGGGGLSLEDGLFWGSDLNRNEQLDIQEAKSIYNLGDENVFAKYDTSGEGAITKFEFYDYLLLRTNEE